MLQEEVISEVKRRLEDYRSDDREIDNQIERLERLEAKMKDVGAQVITDMPRSSNPSMDRMADYVSQKDYLTETIEELIARHKNDRKEIERVILHLREPDERAVIRMRYLDIAPWNEVVDMMFGGAKDFVDKEDTYKRKVFAIHSNAISGMASYIISNRDSFFFTA